MENANPIILALDASSRNVGWTLAQGNRYLNSDVYRPRGDADQRVALIAGWTVQMLRLHDPDLVAIEEPTGSHRNLKTDRLLARVCGNVEGVCTAYSVPVIWVHAMKVKATGLHKDDLWLAARFIGKPSIGPDEADSIGTWQAALTLLANQQTNQPTNQLSNQPTTQPRRQIK